MKKKTLKFTTLAGTLLLGLSAVNPLAVLAEDGASMGSNGTISYVVNTDPTDPLDPTNPDPNKPVNPLEPGDHEDPTPGPLSIDYVSNLRFGEQKTTGEDVTYKAELDRLLDSTGAEISRPNFVQITDKRGSNVGWHLTVTQDEQFMSGEEELTGAVLKLDNATLSTPSDGGEPTASQAISLAPGTASDVIDAQADQGTGIWLNRFGTDDAQGQESVTLTVPGKTKKVQGEYKTSLTWTLTDTPA